jgi:hypothetical protein
VRRRVGEAVGGQHRPRQRECQGELAAVHGGAQCRGCEAGAEDVVWSEV